MVLHFYLTPKLIMETHTQAGGVAPVISSIFSLINALKYVRKKKNQGPIQTKTSCFGGDVLATAAQLQQRHRRFLLKHLISERRPFHTRTRVYLKPRTNHPKISVSESTLKLIKKRNHWKVHFSRITGANSSLFLLVPRFSFVVPHSSSFIDSCEPGTKKILRFSDEGNVKKNVFEEKNGKIPPLILKHLQNMSMMLSPSAVRSLHTHTHLPVYMSASMQGWGPFLTFVSDWIFTDWCACERACARTWPSHQMSIKL